ncbi:MAG: DUF1573 domain-containing protein, partial [Gemmataceae bacterium]
MRMLLGLSIILAAVATGLAGHWALQGNAEIVPVMTVADTPHGDGAYFAEELIELGIVPVGTDATGKFIVKNIGPKSVQFLEARKSCSCTDVTIEPKTLAPGAEATMGFSVRTGALRKPRIESIYLAYRVENEPVAKELTARFTFDPRGVFDITPTSLELTREKPQATLMIEPNARSAGVKV